MNIQTTRERLLASTMIGGAALLAFGVAPAMAQDTTTVSEIVVTGSRIAQANLVTTSPVTQVTGDDFTNTGTTRVEDLINQLPQAFAGQTAQVVNGSSGTATVDLRGLGATRTLVLVNGRRMPYGSPAIAAADLNQIPGPLVERVEVLTGGASAVYGSDAISGVVNFIMRNNFEGVQIDAQYGFFQHTNDYDGVGNVRAEIARRGTTNPSQFALPDDNVIDGETAQVSLIMGMSSPDGRGNITAYGMYRNSKPIFQADRDFSACAIGAPAAARPDTFTCGGSGTNATGNFQFPVDQADPSGPWYQLTLAPDGTFIPFVNDRDLYNYAPINYFQRPEERYSLGFFANYEVNRAAEVYSEFMFTDTSTLAQIAGSGNFFNTDTVTCGNPLLPAQLLGLLQCDPASIAANEERTFYVARRNVEGGGRVQEYNLSSYRGVVGLRGDITDNWSYDLSAQYSRVGYTDVYHNDFSVRRLNESLDVLPDGTCASGAPCVPWNPFVPGGIDQAQLDFLQVPLIATGFVTQQVLIGAITGDLTDYGMMSPWASRGLQVAFGTEYRRDYLQITPDVSYATGDGAGQGGAFQPIRGATSARDWFAEAVLPIAEGLPFAESITLDAAYRHSSYNLAPDTDTWKVGADWAPTRDFRLRASYSTAVRAPNIFNLFSAQNQVLFGGLAADPCGAQPGGAAPTASLADCVATGLPAGLYGSPLVNNSANQYNQLTGGNTNLASEEATTKTYGVVFTPSFLPGFNLSIDYFDVDIENAISTFGAINTINACYGLQGFAQDPVACGRINRGTLGRLWSNDGFVENLSINVGGFSTSGVDLVANYNVNLGDWGMNNAGGLNFAFTGTWLESLVTDTGTGVVYDCVGFFESSCGFPNPEWRHRLTTTWSTPWAVDLSLTWRYFGEVERYGLAAGATPIDQYFDAYNWFDLGVSWQAFDNTRFRFGVNNLLDTDPPIATPQGGNGNTYPTYDSVGRYIFFGVTADF